MSRLFEADFKTIDLRSMASRQNADEPRTGDGEQTNTNNSTPTQDLPAKGDWTAWGDLLKTRLANNRKMSQEARETEYDIESKFFSDFFKANWDEKIAKQLAQMGSLLKKAIKVLGFDIKLNPILAFINVPYVQTELIQTGLLDVNTFKAIYQAVAKNLVADSEFFKENSYNIIYCKDLYSKSSQEILNYLDMQKKTLVVSQNKYTSEIIQKNKKVFLQIFTITNPEALTKKLADASPEFINKYTMTSNTKLNNYNTVQMLCNTLVDGSGGAEERSTQAPQKEYKQLVQKLNTPARKLAALQYLSINTGSAKAKDALTADKLKNVSAQELLDATKWLASQGIIPKGNVTKGSADVIAAAILANLRRGN